HPVPSSSPPRPSGPRRTIEMSPVPEPPALAAPASRKRAFRKTTVGRILFRSPFYFLVVVIFVYALFPFFWAIRSSFTPEGDLFTTPLSWIPSSPTLDNYPTALTPPFFHNPLTTS